MLRPPQPRRIRCGSGAPSAAHGGARTTGRRAGALWAEDEAFWLWRTLLDDSHVEFPGVDDRLIGRRHGRFPPTARTPGAEPLSGEFDALRWYDTQGAAGSWHAGNLSVGEPVFAPGPGDPSEDHGYWTTYATDGTSRLLVFAAREPEAGPVARVRIPVRVPLGLHGCRQPTEE